MCNRNGGLAAREKWSSTRADLIVAEDDSRSSCELSAADVKRTKRMSLMMRPSRTDVEA